MDTQKITTEYRKSQWINIIQKRQDSGQTIGDFCQAAGINKSAYYYWLGRIRKEACEAFEKPDISTDITPTGWMQLSSVAVIPQQTNSTLSIEISGCHITVDINTDPELLKNICRMLRTL